MKTRIQKWGNSLALRIPRSFAEEVGIENETDVDLTLEDEKIVITPVKKMKPELRELLENITEENLHKEVSTGPASGNEHW